MQSINHFEKIRPLIASNIEGLSTEQLLTIPEKFNNNIWWNIAHLVVVQEALHYTRTGVAMDFTPEEMKRYKKNSSPATWETPFSVPRETEINRVKKKLLEQPKILRSRYESGELTTNSYKSYMTSTGIELTSIEVAIEFNNFHEGLHLGAILALKKWVV